jgi:hypothetical protein
MLYAMLAYHVEGVITAMTPEEDAALMEGMHRIHGRWTEDGVLGPAARLGHTHAAKTVRPGAVIDGPYAETKEALLGFYILDCASMDQAVAAAQALQKVNPSAVYELRPVRLYLPGVALPLTDADRQDR